MATPKIKVSLFILKPLKNHAVEIELANYKNPKLKKVHQIFNKEKIKKHTEYTKASLVKHEARVLVGGGLQKASRTHL